MRFNCRQSIHSINGFDWNIRYWTPEAAVTYRCFCLHGFLGSGQDFEKLTAFCDLPIEWICPDLLGHGESFKSTNAAHYNPDFLNRSLGEIRKLFGETHFAIGYSMGGRLLLDALTKKSYEPRHSFLLSASSPLEKEQKKAERLKNDHYWASLIKEKPFQFEKEWNNLPLFSKGKLKIKLPVDIQSREALACCILGLSPGNTFTTWERIEKLEKISYFYGAKDNKYKAIAEKLSNSTQGWEIKEIEDAGHRIISDNPFQVFQKIKSILEGM